MKSALFVWLLLCASLASAQAPVCFRSKYALEPPVRVRNVRLDDGGQLSSKQRSAIVRELRRQCTCWPCVVGEEVGQQVRQMYQWLGYFQATATVDIRQVGGDAYLISAQVEEGPQYRLQEMKFSGAAAFPPEQLRELFGLAPGDLFDTRRLAEGLQRMRHLYATRGYLNFTAIPETAPDPATGSISLRLDLDEGPVFRLGPLSITGLDASPAIVHRMAEAWQPHLGETYNVDFVDRFLDQFFGLSGTEPPRVTYVQDTGTRTVSLRVSFPASQ